MKEIPEDLLIKKGSYLTAQSYGGYQPRQNYQQIFHKPEMPVYTQPAPKTPVLELSKGDMVMHKAFGKGLVLSVMKLGNDALLEVAFDQIGTKKLMANTASAHMKKL